VLLAGAGLLIRSFVTLLDVDPGYRPEHLLTLRVTLSDARYPHQAQREAFYSQVLERVSALPGVRSVAASHHLPLSQSMFRGWLSVPGRTESPPWDEPPTDPPIPIAAVSPAYFKTMGIPLRSGRLFTEADRADSARVVILSASLARDLFQDEDPIGQGVRVPGPGKGLPVVVGVVGDVRHEGLDRDVMPHVYVPLRQSAWPSMALVVRADSDPLRLAAAVRREVLAVDPQLPIYDVQSMEQRLADSMAPRRVNLLLITAFAVLALTLAAVGVYGVIAYSVTQRTHEIGVRLALGARPADVLKLLAGQSMVPVAAGVVLGLFGAWALTRVTAALLFGVSPTDPRAFAGAVMVVTLVALVASYLPARRVLTINPTEALRHE
jgi:putative ABC transport system permease protein